MNLEFLGKQKGSVPFIDSIILTLKDGSDVCVDRDTTEFDYRDETKYIGMRWKCCYIWDGRTRRYIGSDALEGATLKEVVIEDDAPEEYEFECIRCRIANGNVIPIHEK